MRIRKFFLLLSIFFSLFAANAEMREMFSLDTMQCFAADLDRRCAAEESCCSSEAFPKTPPLHVPAGAEWLEVRHNHQCEKMAVWGDQIEVIMVGDSITHLWTWDKPNDPANEPYRGDEVWGRWFGEPKYFNFAFDGGSWQSTLAHLDAAPLEKIHPKAAVILIGINNLRAGDSPESVADGITAVEEKFRSAFPGIKILQLAVFPSGKKPDDPIRFRVNETNRVLKDRLTGKEDVFLLDIGPKLLSPDGTISPEIMPDFLHVNPNGFQIWGREMKPVLDSLLSGEGGTIDSISQKEE